MNLLSALEVFSRMYTNGFKPELNLDSEPKPNGSQVEFSLSADVDSNRVQEVVSVD